MVTDLSPRFTLSPGLTSVTLKIGYYAKIGKASIETITRISGPTDGCMTGFASPIFSNRLQNETQSFFESEAPAKQDQMRLAIELAVSRVFGVDLSALDRVSRGMARISLARQVAMYLAHVGCGLSLTSAGRLFGRDRTTVAHACLIIEDRRDDPLFDRSLDLLEWAVPVMVLRPAAFLPRS